MAIPLCPQAVGVTPLVVISWFLTWFSHDLSSAADAARLFDLFLASHPLMPLYVGAVAMRSQRSVLLACEDMPELHTRLKNLAVMRKLSADQLAGQALEAYRQVGGCSLANLLTSTLVISAFGCKHQIFGGPNGVLIKRL